MMPANLLTEWARLLLTSLEQAGVQDVVISPGSRSTPFTQAALNSGLACRSIIDERVAAFHAVGHAKITGRPVLLICTSGSAAANYYPAVVEAARSGTPLIVLTADRPHELHGADAPQTIDQPHMYGSFARASIDIGVPAASDAALRALQRTAAQAVQRSRWPEAGPIHINARARKPLEPLAATTDVEADLGRRVDRLIQRGVTRAAPPHVQPDASTISTLADAIAGAKRAIIVCGPVAPWLAPEGERVLDLARRGGCALLPEATSQQRFAGGTDDVVVCDAFDALLRSRHFRDGFEPDLVIEIGSPATSTGLRDYFADRPELPRHVLSATGWADPHGGAVSMHVGPLSPALDALHAALDTHSTTTDAGWLAWLRVANTAAWESADEVLSSESTHTEGAAVRAAVSALPDGALLAIGNSLPVRDVDAFCRTGSERLTVWHQRGAAGIDGLIAGAAGAASAARRPTALLLGDVSFAHDVGGLAAVRDLDSPLAIVVLDNQGGRIFEQLPLARGTSRQRDPWRYWSTPPALDVGAAATAFGVAHTRVDAADALGRAVRASLESAGATLIEARLDGDRTIPMQHALYAGIDARLATIGAELPAST